MVETIESIVIPWRLLTGKTGPGRLQKILSILDPCFFLYFLPLYFGVTQMTVLGTTQAQAYPGAWQPSEVKAAKRVF